jgi:hypothetical protein
VGCVLRLIARCAVRLLKRAEPAGARAGESPAASGGLTRMGLSQKSMPPLAGPGGLWHNTSADIVHDASCGHIMPYPWGETARALSNPTLENTEGTLIPASHPAASSVAVQANDKRGLGPPVARAATAVLGANIPRAKPGDVVSMHWSSMREVRTRGDTRAAPSGDLRCARHRQPDESLFG